MAVVAMLAALQGCSSFDSTQEAYNASWKEQKAILIKQVLAPTGSLRVALYRGSPTSLVQPDPKDAPRGVGYQLGEDFAKELGVPFTPKIYASDAEALQAIAANQADFALSTATPEWAQRMNFSPPFLEIEKGVLVLANSRLRVLDDLKKPARIGVSAGGSSAAELRALYPTARLIPINTVADAAEMLRANKIDGYAANKAILFEMNDKLPASRLLPGRWGTERYAAAIPFGRGAGQDWISEFLQKEIQQGRLQAAAKRVNLRGVVTAN
jgi:polar amino acid transport system substrate-binding protein